MQELSLQVQDLKKKLKSTEALKGLSMSFRARTLHGIIGPEGAGKTTFLRHLMGLLKADAGRISYFSEGQEQAFADVRPYMAYMPQSQSLYAELSIHEHLEFFKTLYGLNEDAYRKRREELLKMARLEQFTERLAGQLSGGMYKKLGLICSLLASPRVLLLDEPTNGVDPLSRRDFWSLLYELQEKEDILILITTSYMDEALKCQEVHLLFDGRTLEEGTPKKVLEDHNAENFEAVFLRYDQEGLV
ncbi:ABC transporter ATP-binding protein [Bdellovibrio sp. HCB2-146]|uniref:ABC transporter ATP-binding protein n=1 Tax=Bdellovibrio sp. HCB2-146 TaxID=3394362 RepID=UPI0039BD0C41